LRHLVGAEDPIPTGNIVKSPVPLPVVCPGLKVGTYEKLSIKRIIIPLIYDGGAGEVFSE
jgi:hypothetical protein